jgi:hypothetical protein
MEYPHWMMMAGAILVAAGFIGLAFHRNRNVETDHKKLGRERVNRSQTVAAKQSLQGGAQRAHRIGDVLLRLKDDGVSGAVAHRGTALRASALRSANASAVSALPHVMASTKSARVA